MRKNLLIGGVLLGIAAISFAFVLQNSTVESEGSAMNTPNTEETNVEEINGIQFFNGTWEEALEKAKVENKLIFLDAYATWCGPCKQMSKREFTKKEVGAFFNANFINFKMDMEKGVGPQMAAQLRLKAYPTLYVMDADGKPLLTSVGYLDAESLVEFGKTMVK